MVFGNELRLLSMIMIKDCVMKLVFMLGVIVIIGVYSMLVRLIVIMLIVNISRKVCCRLMLRMLIMLGFLMLVWIIRFIDVW